MADFEVIFMDAGQGDCTLIVYPDGSLTLVDCGSTKSGAQALVEIKKVIDRYFNAKTFLSVVLTHPDEDHYNLLRTLDIERYLDKNVPFDFYYGGDVDLYSNLKDKDYTWKLLTFLKEHDLASNPANSTSIEKDGMLSRAGVDVTILASNCTGDPNGDKNANSIVLLVEYQGAKIFLMGDAIAQTENFIINAFTKAGALHRLQKQQGEFVVLKVGHHGSETSSTDAWIKLLQPDIIVVSAGTKPFNGTGMPKETHLNKIISNTTLTTDTGITQSYVIYDTAQFPPRFAKRPATKKGIWTTCYDVVWHDQPKAYFEAGQSWYFGVELTGKKLIPGHWFGYTGYEDTT